MDHRPGDKQGYCAGNMSGGEVAGRKGEGEANADSPLALLVNPYTAASTEHQPLLWPLELCNKADNKTGSDASSLMAQTGQQNEKS